MTEPLLDLQDVACTFKLSKGFITSKKYTALSNVTLSVYPGETLGIIGANGSGKSTVLKIMAGIYLPDSGKIVKKDGISISLQALGVGFDPELHGRGNIILSGMLMGVRRKVVEQNIEKIIAFADLGKAIDDPVKTYSTGMRARLGFALALELSPDLLLIDEVLGTGDFKFQEKAQAAMFKKINSNQTVVIVSHNMQVIKNICQRVVWLDSGMTKDVGPADQIIEKYKKSFNK